MRAANLPTVHTFINNGQRLRTEMAKAISSVEVYRARGAGEPASAAKLAALFQAGVAAAKGSAAGTTASVSNGQALTLGGKTYTFTVAGGAITAIAVV